MPNKFSDQCALHGGSGNIWHISWRQGEDGEENFVVGARYGSGSADNEMGRVSIELVVFQSSNFRAVELDAERWQLVCERRFSPVLGGDARACTDGAAYVARCSTGICPVREG